MGTLTWHRQMQEITAQAGGLAPSSDLFYFLRHGETELNHRRIIQTQRGVSLNDTGRGQARQAASILAAVEFSEIHSSDLERAWETAEIVSQACGKPMHQAPALQERNWGDWCGQSNIDLNWAGSPQNGETLREFTLRTLRGLNDVLSNGKILIVAHGGSYAVLLAAIGLSITGGPVVRNAAPVRLARDGAG